MCAAALGTSGAALGTAVGGLQLDVGLASHVVAAAVVDVAVASSVVGAAALGTSADGSWRVRLGLCLGIR
jgi:hypothetical protein